MLQFEFCNVTAQRLKFLYPDDVRRENGRKIFTQELSQISMLNVNIISKMTRNVFFKENCRYFAMLRQYYEGKLSLQGRVGQLAVHKINMISLYKRPDCLYDKVLPYMRHRTFSQKLF